MSGNFSLVNKIILLPCCLLSYCAVVIFQLVKKGWPQNDHRRCLSCLIVWADRVEQRASYIVDGEAAFDLIDLPFGAGVGG